jgi:hypothetical protein
METTIRRQKQARSVLHGMLAGKTLDEREMFLGQVIVEPTGKEEVGGRTSLHYSPDKAKKYERLGRAHPKRGWILKLPPFHKSNNRLQLYEKVTLPFLVQEYTRGLSSENLKESDHLGESGTNIMIILK